MDSAGISNLEKMGIQTYTPGFKKEGIEKNDTDLSSMFNKLLVAQVENQNPLDAQNNTDFIDQIAQFKNLDAIEKLQQAFETFSNAFQSGSQSDRVLRSASLVGRMISMPGEQMSQASIKDNGQLTINVPQSVSDLTVSVYNDQNELVKHLPLGQQPGGQINLNLKNQSLPESKQYRFIAEATINGNATQLETLMPEKVLSVSLNDNKDVMLQVNNKGLVPLSSVKMIQ